MHNTQGFPPDPFLHWPSLFGQFDKFAGGNLLLFGICDTRCRPFSFLVFVILDAGLSPFWYLWHSLQAMPSHFWLCGIRYRRGPAMVRNMRAVLKKASCVLS